MTPRSGSLGLCLNHVFYDHLQLFSFRAMALLDQLSLPLYDFYLWRHGSFQPSSASLLASTTDTQRHVTKLLLLDHAFQHEECKSTPIITDVLKSDTGVGFAVVFSDITWCDSLAFAELCTVFLPLRKLLYFHCMLDLQSISRQLCRHLKVLIPMFTHLVL